MISWLKKHFIPHKGNGHRPYLLHGAATRTIVSLIIFLELAVIFVFMLNMLGGSPFLASIFPSVLSVLTNEKRAEANLEALAVNPLLEEAATLKAQDMAERGYFAHTSPEGVEPWHWLDLVGYEYEYAGENLAINFADSMDVTQAWMDSPTHRANIEKAAYTEIGTGIATGTYQGAETVFIVQVYARPAEPKVIVVHEDEEDAQVLGAVTEQVPVPQGPVSYEPQASAVEKLASSPRHASNIIFFGLGGAAALALAFTLLSRLGKNHPDLAMNGLLMIALVLGVYIANGYIARMDSSISTAVDYSSR